MQPQGASLPQHMSLSEELLFHAQEARAPQPKPAPNAPAERRLSLLDLWPHCVDCLRSEAVNAAPFRPKV